MRSHRLHRLIISFLIGFVMVLALSPTKLGEKLEQTITIIKPSEAKANPYQREYEEMLYPTVRITAGDTTGSGVIFETTDEHESTRIYILTAAHVVEDESIVTVETTDEHGLTRIDASVVITETDKDLALLRIETTDSTDIYKAKLAPRNYQPYLFAPVWVVGCSLGLNPRPSYGHLSALGASVADYWEVSAPILPGNSGGPVFDGRTYEVIGIVIWVKVYNGQLVTTMAGIVPISEIYEFLDGYKKLQRVPNKVTRGYRNLSVTPVGNLLQPFVTFENSQIGNSVKSSTE